MIRRTNLTTAIIVVCAAAALTGGGLAYAATGGTSSPHSAANPAQTTTLHHKHAKWPTPTVAKWQVLEAPSGARSVVISVQQPITTAGCPSGAKATATETPSAIRLHVTVKYQKAPACSVVLQGAEVRVPLHSPVDDRKIEGAGLI